MSPSHPGLSDAHTISECVKELECLLVKAKGAWAYLAHLPCKWHGMASLVHALDQNCRTVLAQARLVLRGEMIGQELSGRVREGRRGQGGLQDRHTWLHTAVHLRVCPERGLLCRSKGRESRKAVTSPAPSQTQDSRKESEHHAGGLRKPRSGSRLKGPLQFLAPRGGNVLPGILVCLTALSLQPWAAWLAMDVQLGYSAGAKIKRHLSCATHKFYFIAAISWLVHPQQCTPIQAIQWTQRMGETKCSFLSMITNLASSYQVQSAIWGW